mmetsp:Transcript_472/g.1241  ORF Transcript_472/g.1241 Transcript_472/m.1241 type:complete len:234 (-) Transcript_472:25-726(-)
MEEEAAAALGRREERPMCLEVNVGEAGLVGNGALGDEAGGGPHGESAVVDLLQGHVLGDLELEGVEAPVAGRAFAGLAALGDGDAGDDFDEAEEEQGRGEFLGVLVDDGPEDVDLGLADGIGVARQAADALLEPKAEAGEHGDAGVLDLGLAEPVEVEADVGELREAQGVEADVPGEGSVEEGGFLEEGHRGGLFEEGRRRLGRRRHLEGQGRRGEEGHSADSLHHRRGGWRI